MSGQTLRSEDLRYSFFQFCLHRNIISKTASKGRVIMEWEIYKNQYIEFCKDNELEYEILDNQIDNVKGD